MTLNYKLIRKPEHLNACSNGQIKEHVYIMSEMLGRPLDGFEVVHHIDENPLNNHPDNLQLFVNQAAHVTHHNILRAQKNALLISGDASYMKCPYCKVYSAPSEMSVSKARHTAYHKACKNTYMKAWKLLNKQKATQ